MAVVGRVHRSPAGEHRDIDCFRSILYVARFAERARRNDVRRPTASSQPTLGTNRDIDSNPRLEGEPRSGARPTDEEDLVWRNWPPSRGVRVILAAPLWAAPSSQLDARPVESGTRVRLRRPSSPGSRAQPRTSCPIRRTRSGSSEVSRPRRPATSGDHLGAAPPTRRRPVHRLRSCRRLIPVTPGRHGPRDGPRSERGSGALERAPDLQLQRGR
jgi:hypothetical protein